MKKLVQILLAAIISLTFTTGAASAQTQTSQFTSTMALKLVVTAQQYYWATMTGHVQTKTNMNCAMVTFKYNNTEYRYFCPEIGTKKKLEKYLNKVFTRTAIKKGMLKYKFIEHKGKLAQPNADFGSLLNWSKAKVRLLYHRNDVRLFEFKIPYGEKDHIQWEIRKVTFVKIGSSWLINSFDAVS